MKRIFYILTAALVALTACTKESDWNSIPVEEGPDAVYPEGASIDLVFGVPVPPQTRGEMDDEPIIDTDGLHVAVFDGSGSLKQYKLAEFVPVTENGSGGMKFFKVNLNLRSSEARLHFIANGPAAEDVSPGMESALFQQWVTEYPNGAYWQRIVLPEGITAYSFSDKKSDGTPWADGDKIIFYYYEHLDDDGETTVYDHITESMYNTHKDETGYGKKEYTISMNGSRPQYTDSATPSHTVNVGDFVNAMGNKILDGTGYFQSASITDAVSSVPLVRNFARIKVRAGAGGNFTPTQYYLMNIPDKGTIAPYSSAVGGFAEQYSVSNYKNNAWDSGDPLIYELTEGDDESHDELMTALNGSRYPADFPMSGELIHTTADAKVSGFSISDWGDPYSVGATTATVENTPSAFMFERGIPNKNQDPTYLLIGGTLTGHGTRWFKVELTNSQGQYIRIFRDVTYFLEIGQIDGSEGYATPEEAAKGEPVSDVSNSLATENLEQVSDGKGTSMWVEYIDYVGNSPDGEEKSILYKVYDSSTGEALDATIGGESRYTLTINTEAGSAIQSIVSQNEPYNWVGPDGKEDWMIAVVKLAPSSVSGIQHGELQISGITKDGETYDNGKTLSRKVKYHVMSVQNLVLSATPLGTEASGQKTKLSITLPDGLGYSLFPLVLKIEAEKGNLNPVAADNVFNGVAVDLPVESGTSYFSDKNSFGFLFTINYSDYYDRTNASDPYNNTFELTFATTKDYTASGSTGSNETWFSVTDQNGYFFYKPDDVADMYNDRTSGATPEHTNYAVTPVKVTNGNQFFSISPQTQTVTAETTTATFTIKANSGQTWTVTGGTGVTVSPDSGKGNGTVKMTFSANTQTSSRSFTATVKYTPNGGTEKTETVTVTQRGVTSYSVNLNNSWQNATSSANPDTELYEAYMSQSNLGNSSISTMSITVSGYTEFVVYIASDGEQTYDYLVVRNTQLSNWNSPESNAIASTRYENNSGVPNSLDDYTRVSIPLDGGQNTIYFQYGKDRNTSSGTDKGYILIPKNQ